MHSNYGSSILDYDGDDLDNMCSDVVEGFLAGPTRYGLGELDPSLDNYYDERSHIDKALGKYNGSIYWVQGCKIGMLTHTKYLAGSCTNWYQTYIDEGYEAAGMLGQWEHNYPDQWTKHKHKNPDMGEAIHNMTRWDWGQDLFEWMEYYLKGIGPKPALHAQIQRNDGEWRIEDTWPPQDLENMPIDMSDCSSSGSWVGTGGLVLGGDDGITVDCGPLDGQNDTHISGLATMHLTVVPSFDGGQFSLRCKMRKLELDWDMLLDVRYHAGGYDAQTVIPAKPSLC